MRVIFLQKTLLCISLLIISLSWIEGCDNGTSSYAQIVNNDTFRKFSSFPINIKPNFHPVFKFENPYARKLFLTDSSIILTNNKNFLNDFFFYEYSLNTKQIIGKYIHGGRKSGETLAPIFSGLLRNNLLWFYDISLEKVLVAKLNKSYQNDSLEFEEYKIPSFSYSVQLMESNKLLRSGISDTSKLFDIINLQDGRRITAFGNLPPTPSGIPFGSWKMANEGFLFLKPSGEFAAYGYRYTDKVTILNLETKKLLTISGPNHFEPAFIPILVGSENRIERTEKTIYAFTNGAVTDQYIYLLYSGNKTRDKYRIEAKYIYVYDWDGNPVKKIELGRYISGFTVPNDDSGIYAFDVENSSVLYAPLKKMN